MNPSFIFWPVLTQILLTLVLYMLLGARKARALKSGDVDRSRTALHHEAWPDDVLQVSNSIRNQFETPVLFYVLAVVLFLIDGVDSTVLVLAWVYVAGRIVHAGIHITSNYVPWRFRVFAFGIIVLLVLAFLAARRLLVG